MFALLENTAIDLSAEAKKIDFSRLEPEHAQQTLEALDGLAAASYACRYPTSGASGSNISGGVN